MIPIVSILAVTLTFSVYLYANELIQLITLHLKGFISIYLSETHFPLWLYFTGKRHERDYVLYISIYTLKVLVRLWNGYMHEEIFVCTIRREYDESGEFIGIFTANIAYLIYSFLVITKENEIEKRVYRCA